MTQEEIATAIKQVADNIKDMPTLIEIVATTFVRLGSMETILEDLILLVDANIKISPLLEERDRLRKLASMIKAQREAMKAPH